MQNGLIALGPLIRALAHKSYQEFGIEKDKTHGEPTRTKRDLWLEYLPMARHRLIRFLVLVRYLKANHGKIKALEKIHETMIKSEHQYATACQNFDELYTEMVTTMEPSWDIETALHVLTLGSYRNLPKIIDDSIADNPHNINKNLSQKFVSSTIKRLNNQLRVRLLSDSIPPELKLQDIKQGMVFMIAKNEFEITISLRMRPKLLQDFQENNDDDNKNEKELEQERVRWSLFDLKLLLKASLNTKENDAKCIVTNLETNALLLTVNQKMKLSKYPLQKMYHELNAFCLKLQFAVLSRQLHSIRYNYGDKNIRIEREQQKFITIRMWKFAPKLPNDARSIIDGDNDNKYNDNNDNDDDDQFNFKALKDIQQKQKQQEIQWRQQQQQFQLQSKTNYSRKSKSILGSSYHDTMTNFNVDALDEFERKENEIKSKFRISLTILYEEQGLDITYHPKFPSFITNGTDDLLSSDDDDDDDYDNNDDDNKYDQGSWDGIKNLLCVDPTNLNLPKLIENFTILHSNYRLLYLLNKLIELDKEYKISPKVKAINCQTHSKKVLFAIDNDECLGLMQKDKIKIMKNLQSKYIEICLYDKDCNRKCIEIYVNSDNGKIMLEKSYQELISNKPLVFEKNMKIYNDEINKDLSRITNIVTMLKIDCLLENVIETVQNETKLQIVSYSPCNKPNKYHVIPSILMHDILKLGKKIKKKVTIQENGDSKQDKMEQDDDDEEEKKEIDIRDIAYRSHLIQKYSNIMDRWNESNCIYITIPRFGKHCYLVIHFKSHQLIETYCIVTDHFGNLLYLHDIVRDDKLNPEYHRGEIQISSKLIQNYIAYCIKILPQHLIQIMISSHIQKPITQLKWNQNKSNTKSTKFPIIFPRAATTSNSMHIMPRKFDFEISLYEKNNSFSWKCVVKQDTIFANHKISLLSKLNEAFKVESNSLVFEYKNNLNIGEFSTICDYCYKLLVIYNILKGFIDRKQIIKQTSSFYQKDFYKLKKIDLISHSTIIEIEFSLFDKSYVGNDKKTFIMKLEIIWNDIDNVEFYNNKQFNLYLNNTSYVIQISFCDSNGNITNNLYESIPNLKLIILHYFDYRRRYHKQLNILLRNLSKSSNNHKGQFISGTFDDDHLFDAHDAMTKFKQFIGSTQHNVNSNKNILNAKQQSFIFLQYESLSFMMFLQKLYWTIKALNYINPFLECMNFMHKWYYPKHSSFIQTKVTKHDTLRIICPFYQAKNDNILAIRILNENKIAIQRIECQTGWQLTLDEIDYTKASNILLKYIQSDLLNPRKSRLLLSLFEGKQNQKRPPIINNLIETPLQKLMYPSLKELMSVNARKDNNFKRFLNFVNNDPNFNLEFRKPRKEKIETNNTNKQQQATSLYQYQKTLERHYDLVYKPNQHKKQTENGKKNDNLKKIDNVKNKNICSIKPEIFELVSTKNLEFIDEVIKAYFYLYGDNDKAYCLYHELKMQSFISTLIVSLNGFFHTARHFSSKTNRQLQMKYYSVALVGIQEIFCLLYDELLQLSIHGGRIQQILPKKIFDNHNLYTPIKLTSSHNITFWYNLNHINDLDIIFNPGKAVCVQVHLAQMIQKPHTKSTLKLYKTNVDRAGSVKVRSPSATVPLSSNESPSPSKSVSPPKRVGLGRAPRGRGRRVKKRGGKLRNLSTRNQNQPEPNGHSKMNGNGVKHEKKKDKNGHHNHNGGCNKNHNNDNDEKKNNDGDNDIWAFEKYELSNDLFLNIGVCLDHECKRIECPFGEIFFYQNNQRVGRKSKNAYREMYRMESHLVNLYRLTKSINDGLKQNGCIGSLIISFLRQFVIRLSEIKRTDDTEFNLIWKQLKKLT